MFGYEEELKDELIEFAMYLTGHDRETIEQMYRDWNSSENPDSSGEDYQDDSDSWSGGFADNH